MGEELTETLKKIPRGEDVELVSPKLTLRKTLNAAAEELTETTSLKRTPREEEEELTETTSLKKREEEEELTETLKKIPRGEDVELVSPKLTLRMTLNVEEEEVSDEFISRDF